MPTRAEYDTAAQRERVRNLYSAKLKLYRMAGREDDLWQKLSDYDREVLRADTEEQTERDRQIIESWRRAHDIADDSGAAARARQKLRSMTRVLNR